MQPDIGSEPTMTIGHVWRAPVMCESESRFGFGFKAFFSWIRIQTSKMYLNGIALMGNTFRYMNYCPVIFFQSQTDRQTESDACEPTVQCAQVGSKR